MISIVIPLYNGESTVLSTLKSLLAQSQIFEEIIINDDYSRDHSVDLINKYLKRHPRVKYQIIRNKKPGGLAAAYNNGFRHARGDLVVTVHQDVVLKKNALKRLTEPFFSKDSAGIVASTHVAYYPLETWERYNFWQKCFFARHLGKRCYGLDGKFDCFRRDVIGKIGYFDQESFHTAGEDGDIRYKLKKIGQIANTEAEIIHLHRIDEDFNFRDIINKQAQYSEAQGALLKKGMIPFPGDFIRTFFREILLALLLVPYIRFLSLGLICFYSIFYTYPMFQRESRDLRILLLPGLNIYLLFISFLYSFRGYLYGKQTI